MACRFQVPQAYILSPGKVEDLIFDVPCEASEESLTTE